MPGRGAWRRDPSSATGWNQLSGTPKLLLRLLGTVNKAAGQLPDIWHRYDRPWVADDGRFQRTFGPRPATPCDEGIAATVDWYRRRSTVT